MIEMETSCSSNESDWNMILLNDENKSVLHEDISEMYISSPILAIRDIKVYDEPTDVKPKFLFQQFPDDEINNFDEVDNDIGYFDSSDYISSMELSESSPSPSPQPYPFPDFDTLTDLPPEIVERPRLFPHRVLY